ncbi:MAG TPA: SdpA family antimicrobial peptide system protein [Flavipsychrobacter sp.]|nr:SdpA family antimicrobial peptide system protein [Flavipsychrobacter sp.]
MTKSLLIFCLSGMLVAVTVFYNMSIDFGNNPLNNSYLARYKMISIMPQGWAFFTKDPKEAKIYVYRVIKNKLYEVSLKSTSAQNYFGISRENRIRCLQVGHISQRIQYDTALQYHYSAVNLDSFCYKFNSDTCKYYNINIDKKICPGFSGKYILIVQSVLPWSLLHKVPGYLSRFVIYPINISQV